MITTAPFIVLCGGDLTIPLPSSGIPEKSATLALVVPGLRCYLAGQPKVVFMARPGRVS